MARAKRHHYVPRAYLDRFAAGGNVLVRRRDGRTFAADPVNVAVEAGLYDVRDATGAKSAMVEDVLANLDSLAVDAMRSVDLRGVAPNRGSEERLALALYLGMQVTRTPESRDRLAFPSDVARYAADHRVPVTRELVAEYLERVHFERPPLDDEITAATAIATAPDFANVTPEARMKLMLDTALKVMPEFDAMNWCVEADRKGRLITSDVPLVVWREPSPRDEVRGFGVLNAHELRFPLDPCKQLVLSRSATATTRRMTANRVRSSNEDMAASARDFVVGCPATPRPLEALALARRGPVMRFNSGPMYEYGPDGRSRRVEGEVIHMWTPRR